MARVVGKRKRWYSLKRRHLQESVYLVGNKNTIDETHRIYIVVVYMCARWPVVAPVQRADWRASNKEVALYLVIGQKGSGIIRDEIQFGHGAL